MTSQLVTAAKPYLELFACFTLTPPPFAFLRSQKLQSHRIIRLWLFAFYALLMLALSIWVAYINSFILDALDEDRAQDSITNVLDIVQNICVALVHATILFNMIISYGSLCRIWNTIDDLECAINESIIMQETISNHHRQFGLRWRLATRAGGLALFLAISLPRVKIPLLADFMTLPNKLVTAFILFIVQFKTVEYCIIVLLVQELLLRLKCVLHELQLEMTTLVPHQELPMREALCIRLRVNQHLLARIWLLVTEVESYFMLPMLFLFLYNGVAITHIINWAYIQSLNPKDCCRYVRIANVLILVVNIMIPSWLSQCCINTYNRFVKRLYNLKSDGSDRMLTMRLREYSLQLMHQKILFTCGGFFDINLKYFGYLILTITTYVVILIQFKLQEAHAEGKEIAKLDYQ